MYGYDGGFGKRLLKYQARIAEEQRALYEIREIIDRMHDTGIHRTIDEIDQFVSEDDPNYDKKRRRQEYLYAMEQLYGIREYDPEYWDTVEMSLSDIYYQYKENNRPHTW